MLKGFMKDQKGWFMVNCIFPWKLERIQEKPAYFLHNAYHTKYSIHYYLLSSTPLPSGMWTPWGWDLYFHCLELWLASSRYSINICWVTMELNTSYIDEMDSLKENSINFALLFFVFIWSKFMRLCMRIQCRNPCCLGQWFLFFWEAHECY